MARSAKINSREFDTAYNDLIIGGGLVSDEAPADGQLMRYDASTGKWRPHDPSGGGTVTTSGTPTAGKLAKFSGATVVTNADLTGDVTTAGGLAATLANTAVTPGSYGDATHIPEITVDSKGRITAAAQTTFSAGGGFLTAVVDILPTTNIGPGDQTKGIKNWSALPITIVLAPGANKYIHVVVWSYQFKPGTAAYVDTHAQTIGLTADANYGGLTANSTVLGLATNADILLPGLSYFVAPASGWAGGSTSTRAFSNNAPLLFGDLNGGGELTTGDGQARITVKYTIDDILI